MDSCRYADVLPFFEIGIKFCWWDDSTVGLERLEVIRLLNVYSPLCFFMFLA